MGEGVNRVIVVQTAQASDRFALPAVGSVTFGSDARATLRIDAELAPDHAVLFIDDGVAIEIHDDDSSWARIDDEVFKPLKKGQTIDLSNGDRVRLGAAEIALVEIEPVVAVARVLHKQAFEPFLAARIADPTRTSDVVARLRFAAPVPPDALSEAVARALRPGDVAAPVSASDVVVLLADVTPVAARRLLSSLGLGELTAGIVDPREVELAKLLPLAAERLAPLASADAARIWISDDPAMRAVDALVNRAAAGMAHVLLLGETGAGKDVYAQLIHERSSRAGGTFVRVSCVELSETFANDEAGKLIARARGGTLHIDEVTGLSARAQLGLGYALDEAESAGLDVRFIASSNHDLMAAVEAGQFRKDLYYRLDQLQIAIPPLRERAGDVMPLVELFMRGSSSKKLGDRPRAALEAYSWPGNVRELRNTIERAMLLAGDAAITMEHLPPALRMSSSAAIEAPSLSSESSGSDGQVSLKSEIAALEKRRILEALRKYPTQREAAEALEMPMRTFLNRLDALGIQRARGGGQKTSDGEE